jgi:hypothetical protein
LYFTLKGLLSFSSCNRFSIFSSFVIAFLASNLDFGYLGLSFSVYVDIKDGDCGCSSVSDRSFLLLSMGIWLSLMTYTAVLYGNDDCSFVYNAKMLGVYVRG